MKISLWASGRPVSASSSRYLVVERLRPGPGRAAMKKKQKSGEVGAAEGKAANDNSMGGQAVDAGIVPALGCRR